MTITLTKEELEIFQDALAEWYDRRFFFLIENFNPDRSPLHHGEHYGYRGNITELIEKFQTSNPKPDWRTLL